MEEGDGEQTRLTQPSQEHEAARVQEQEVWRGSEDWNARGVEVAHKD